MQRQVRVVGFCCHTCLLGHPRSNAYRMESHSLSLARVRSFSGERARSCAYPVPYADDFVRSVSLPPPCDP